MADIRVLLGQRIHARRAAMALSQEELAHIAKMDRVFLGQLERGQRSASIESIGKLAQALGLEPKDLLDFGRKLPKPKRRAHEILADKVAVLAQDASPWELKKFERLAETFFEEHHPRRQRT